MIRTLLKSPRVYDLLQFATGWNSTGVEAVMNAYVRARDGDRVLEVGCATAASLSFMPAVEYVGADMNPAYIAAARTRCRGRGHFITADVTRSSFSPEGDFDIILMFGLLHHLDGCGATRLLARAATLLKPDGRLITTDNVRESDQSALERLLLKMDRGDFVRARDDYAALLRPHFSRIDLHVRDDLLRFPYRILVMEARL